MFIVYPNNNRAFILFLVEMDFYYKFNTHNQLCTLCKFIINYQLSCLK